MRTLVETVESGRVAPRRLPAKVSGMHLLQCQQRWLQLLRGVCPSSLYCLPDAAALNDASSALQTMTERVQQGCRRQREHALSFIK